MRSDYIRLTELSVNLNEEKENLIQSCKNYELRVSMIKERLDQIEKLLESNYKQQEMYWPNFNEEVLVADDLVSDFFMNPDQSMQELGEKWGVSVHRASDLIKKKLQLNYGKA